MTVKGKGGRRRSLAQMAKDALAAEFHILGFQVREVAEKLGYRSPGGAHTAIQRGLADRAAFRLTRDETLTWVMEALHILVRKQYEIAETTHYAVTPTGRVVTMVDPQTGEESLVLDDGPKHRALVEVRQLITQIAMLNDLKPATKQRVEHISQDLVNEEIQKLAKELGEAPDGKPPSRGIAREPGKARKAPGGEG